jgi:2,3-bisphosphoglycerate-independent phosphoglycerate mutase
MDRDHRWDRTRAAYELITNGIGTRVVSATEGIRNSYDGGITDEFIEPIVVGEPEPLQPGDSFLFANFRSDRGRQLTAALAEHTFGGFERFPDLSGKIRIATLTRYEEGLPVEVVFPPHDVVNPLARVISEAGRTQFHCAETEKYPHVTFFLNGGREEPFPGEERVMVPSPKVATYDLQPEMSAKEVADATIRAIQSGQFDFVVVNFANCDMVGHTGDFAATVRAVETVDTQLGRVLDALEGMNGVALVIADHGNAEEMIDRSTGGPMTAHTTNPVPCILVGADNVNLSQEGVLSAIAPTVLDLMDIPIPQDMTTPSLVG